MRFFVLLILLYTRFLKERKTEGEEAERARGVVVIGDGHLNVSIFGSDPMLELHRCAQQKWKFLERLPRGGDSKEQSACKGGCSEPLRLQKM